VLKHQKNEILLGKKKCAKVYLPYGNVYFFYKKKSLIYRTQNCVVLFTGCKQVCTFSKKGHFFVKIGDFRGNSGTKKCKMAQKPHVFSNFVKKFLSSLFLTKKMQKKRLMKSKRFQPINHYRYKNIFIHRLKHRT